MIPKHLLETIDRYLLRPLRMRMANMIARAVIQNVDDSTKMQLVQIGVEHGVDLDDAERFQECGFTCVPLPGAEAVVLFPNGDRGHPLVVAVDDRSKRPTGNQPGEPIMYSLIVAGRMIKIDASGIVHIGEAGLGASDGVVHGTGIDPFTGATYHTLTNTSAVVRAKK